MRREAMWRRPSRAPKAPAVERPPCEHVDVRSCANTGYCCRVTGREVIGSGCWLCPCGAHFKKHPRLAS